MLYRFSCSGTWTLYLCAFSRQIPLLKFLFPLCMRTNFNNAKPLVKLIVWFHVFQKLNIILNYSAFAIFFHTLYVYKRFKFHFSTFFTTLLTATLLPNQYCKRVEDANSNITST